MKIQIARLSPHQNAKVFGVLMAIGSLFFVVPMIIAIQFIPAGVDAQGHPPDTPSALFVLMFPVIYLVMGYVMVVIGCWLYNIMFRFLGGFEYDVRDQ